VNIIDECSRECLAMVPQRRLRSDDVLAVLVDMFVEHGPPEHIRSDNGPEFAARALRDWLGKVGVKTLFIEPGSPWENGYIESFNAPAQRAARWRDLLHARGGTRDFRLVARALQ
jgi:putative transposase